ncbi:MAG: FAD-binding oxidoreductase [Thermoguttaceae bacterium]|jgi:glycolate oxidase FAD binding subunit
MSTQNLLPLTKTLTPADQAEVAVAVRAAYGEKMAVYPIGGGAGQDYGVPPTEPGLGLSLLKLGRLIDYQPDDLTITVEAGMTMAELSKILVRHRQRLPIDVALPDRTTIGGAAAVNASGPRQFACGTMRDFVLGFTAVDGQGTIFSGGGRVLKNAAGYNISRLMVGSLGTLGIITQLTLMVRPVPEMSALVACDTPDLETADKLIAELMQSPIRPAAVELALGPGRQDNPVLVPMPKGSAARLIIGFEGPAVEVQWMLDTLRNMWQAAGVASPMTVTNAWAKSLWDWLADFPAQVQILVHPSAVTNMIGAIVSLDPDCTIQAHAGSGIVRVKFSDSKVSDPQPNNVPTAGAVPGEKIDELETQTSFAFLLRRRLRPLVEDAGGKLAVFSSSQGDGLTCRDVWGPKGDAFAVMQSLKDRFDPAGILNPGRFIFDK